MKYAIKYYFIIYIHVSLHKIEKKLECRYLHIYYFDVFKA